MIDTNGKTARQLAEIISRLRPAKNEPGKGICKHPDCVWCNTWDNFCPFPVCEVQIKTQAGGG